MTEKVRHFESIGDGLAGKLEVNLGPCGIKYDGDKPDFSLLPTGPLEDLVRVYMFGCRKYEKDNWRRGFDFSRIWAAAQRHMLAWKEGEDIDPESAINHLAHAMWGMMTLLYFQQHKDKFSKFDNRYIEEREEAHEFHGKEQG